MTIGFDNSLNAELKKGNEEAFAALFSKYGKMMYALAFRYLKSEEDAEDAVQYTFMKLWSRRFSLNFGDNVGNLLYTTLKNHVLNELRHRNIILENAWLMAQENEEADDSFIRQMEKKNQWELLINGITALPPRKRDICMLKIIKGMSNKEIAEQLDIKVPTVKVHYNQAIRMLKKALLFVAYITILNMR
ncbi:MAG: RNA polymerase sigma factor [Candidatus Cryptobacteroides sp.]